MTENVYYARAPRVWVGEEWRPAVRLKQKTDKVGDEIQHSLYIFRSSANRFKSVSSDDAGSWITRRRTFFLARRRALLVYRARGRGTGRGGFKDTRRKRSFLFFTEMNCYGGKKK